jgi:hypothetical protein
MSNDPGNVNGFAASFEDDSGKAAGALAADFGSTARCAATAPTPFPAVSTYTYGDCHAVMGRNDTPGGAPPSWTFMWTAPNDGSTVTMYYGVVDGNCMMDSLGDDVKAGTKKLGSGTAAREVRPLGGDRMLACLGLFPAFALVGLARRRRC